MNLLIDTHILLYVLFESEKLPSKITAALKNSSNKVCVSSITFWEISIKFGLNKLGISGYNPEDLVPFCEQMGIEILDVSVDIYTTSHNLQRFSNHRDPFDRLLLWQSIQEKLTIVSMDRKFSQYKECGLTILEA